MGKFNRFKLIPVKQPCDFVCAYKGLAAAVDTKTQGVGKTFNYSSINMDQVHSMHVLAEQGMIAGYLVWLRQVDKLVFFSTKQLLECQPDDSLKIVDGIDLGNIESPTLKRLFTLTSLSRCQTVKLESELL